MTAMGMIFLHWNDFAQIRDILLRVDLACIRDDYACIKDDFAHIADDFSCTWVDIVFTWDVFACTGGDFTHTINDGAPIQYACIGDGFPCSGIILLSLERFSLHLV